MLGWLYFILTLFLGGALCLLLYPHFAGVGRARPLFKGKRTVPPFMVVMPLCFVLGTMVSAWLCYLTAYALAFTGYGMAAGVCLVATVSLGLGLLALWLRRALVMDALRGFRLRDFIRSHYAELLFCLAVLAFWGFFMVRSFYFADGQLRVGFSVYSDFAPHLAVIRSFSLGENIPTSYPHFADGTIRYHFMFQFAAATLEWLGMRLDVAFNLLSVLSMLAAMQLLYALCLQVAGSRLCANLCALFFTFRSSFAAFTYFSGQDGLLSGIKNLFGMSEHIGNTQNESWGLWTQKVYLNQRHLAIGFAVAFFVILCFYPCLVKAYDGLFTLRGKGRGARLPLSRAFRALFLTADGWMPSGLVMPLCLGLLMGMLGFFNGAVTVSLLVVLFFMAVVSRQRLSFALAAALAAVLVLAESKLFIPTGGGAVSPSFCFGFLAEEPTLGSSLAYLLELLGVLPLLLLAALPVMPRGVRWLTLCFAAPIAVAFTLQLTPDITVNHKYIMFACALLDVVAGALLATLFYNKSVLARFGGAVLVLLMTVTGFCDLACQWSIDKNHMSYEEQSGLAAFIREQTPPGSVFLTDTTYVLGDITLSGRLLYCGWSYYAWSAGYDTFGRTQTVAELYACDDGEELRERLRQEGIDYIYLDQSNRTTTDYVLNEQLIADNFACVYSDGEVRIFDAAQPA